MKVETRERIDCDRLRQAAVTTAEYERVLPDAGERFADRCVDELETNMT